MADLLYVKDVTGSLFVRIGDKTHNITGLVNDPKPVGSDRGGVRSIHFDGVVGVIQRNSVVPGRVDIEHFLGADCLKPFTDAFASADALAEQKRRELQEANERAATEALRLAQEQEDARIANAAEAAAKSATASPSA